MKHFSFSVASVSFYKLKALLMDSASPLVEAEELLESEVLQETESEDELEVKIQRLLEKKKERKIRKEREVMKQITLEDLKLLIKKEVEEILDKRLQDTGKELPSCSRRKPERGCSYCKMENHSRDECFRLKRKRTH